MYMYQIIRYSLLRSAHVSKDNCKLESKKKRKQLNLKKLFVILRCKIEGVFVIFKHKKVIGKVFVSNIAACVYTVCS